MTLPSERTKAVLEVGDFLRRLSSPRYEDSIKNVRTQVRLEARRMLRHYPAFADLMRDDAFDADTAEKYGLKWYARQAKAKRK